MRQNLFIQFSWSCYFQGGGGHYFWEVATFRGLLLLVGFTSGHKKLALISGRMLLTGNHYYQNFYGMVNLGC